MIRAWAPIQRWRGPESGDRAAEVLPELRRRELPRERQAVRWPDPVGGRLLWAAGGRRARRLPRRHGARSPDRSRSDEPPRGHRRPDRTDDGRWRRDFGGDPRAQLPDGRLRGSQDGSFRRLAAGLGIWLLSLFLVFAAGITAWIAGGQLDPATRSLCRATRSTRDRYIRAPRDRAGPGRSPLGRGARWRLARRPFPPRRRPGVVPRRSSAPPPDPAGESDDQPKSHEAETRPRPRSPEDYSPGRPGVPRVADHRLPERLHLRRCARGAGRRRDRRAGEAPGGPVRSRLRDA